MLKNIADTNHKRIVRFSLVGLFNTGLDFALFNALLHLLASWNIGHLKVNVCNMISASSVTMVSYELNNRYVFKTDKRLPHHYRLYFLIIVLSGIFLLQNGIISFTLSHLGSVTDLIHSTLQSIGLNLNEIFIKNNFAKACATIATMTWNYLLFKRVIFKPEA